MQKLLTLFFVMAALTGAAQNKPISLLKANPHYFDYAGKPTVLITSGEHYGAVMSTDFDFVTYLKELKRNGLNMTRTMTGAYFEHPEAFNIAANTMGPKPSEFICPFARSTQKIRLKKGINLIWINGMLLILYG